MDTLNNVKIKSKINVRNTIKYGRQWSSDFTNNLIINELSVSIDKIMSLIIDDTNNKDYVLDTYSEIIRLIHSLAIQYEVDSFVDISYIVITKRGIDDSETNLLKTITALSLSISVLSNKITVARKARANSSVNASVWRMVYIDYANFANTMKDSYEINYSIFDFKG